MNKSFTLIEILVVIVIIGILSGFIIVSMTGVSQKATIAKGQAFSNSLKNALLLNLTAEWKLNGPTAAGSPATTDDIKDSWTTNNGVLCTAGGIFPHPTPTVRSGADCISGNCLEFDNIDDQYYVNNPNLRYIGAGMTLEAWIKINSAASNEAYIFSKPWNGNGYYNYRFHYSNDVIYFYLRGDTDQSKIINTSNNIQKNKWYNVVATVDSSKLMKVFVNGVLDVSDTHTITTWIPSVGGDQNLAMSIGHIYRCDQSVPDRIFHGHMDELKYFTEAVPASRVKESYYSGLNGIFLGSGDRKEYARRLSELKSQVGSGQ